MGFLAKILPLADLVKFAKYFPLPDDHGIVLANAYLFVNVTNDHTIAAEFEPDEFVLTVTTAHGESVPSGVITNLRGATIEVSIGRSPVPDGDRTQYVCVGWTGTGSVAPGEGLVATVVLTRASALAWLWRTQVWFAATAEPGGSVTASNGWHDLNSGSYYLAGVDNEIKTPWDWNQKGRWADFQPDALRRLGTK